MFTSVFITLLFTVPKIWKQPKGSSIDEWIKKKWYKHRHAQANIT